MNNKEENYKIVFLKTKTKTRKIITYKENDELKLRTKHQRINTFFEENLVQSDFSYAYRKHRSIYDNARVHLINNYFIKLDIKSFFNNINLKKMSEMLWFELNKSVKISKKEVSSIVDLCSVYKKGLPLGLINSPMLANIYLKEFDSFFYGDLKKLASEFGISNILYTRYADDLTISFKDYDSINSMKEIADVIRKSASNKLANYSLKLNDKKDSLVDLAISNHVRITGVSITIDQFGFRRIAVGRKKIRELYLETLRIYDLYRSQKTISYYEVQRLSGMESFILSIEKQGYSKKYSEGMIKHIRKLGFDSLSDMILFLKIECQRND